MQQWEKRRTDILRLRNIRFTRDGRVLPHDHPFLHLADTVSSTFEWQKKDERNDTITQRRTNHHFLCPVKQAAAIIKRIRSYPGSNDDTPLSAVWRHDRIEHISSEEMVQSLRAAVIAIGEDILGVSADDIGTHSIRSGAAMAMYLGECPVFTIMLIGRWSSQAFLRYIRKQVEQFSQDISSKMIKVQFFRHVPDAY